MFSSDARAQMMYDAGKKSVFLTYVLWFFLWGVSMHRLYLHKWVSALIQFLVGTAGFAFLFGAFMPGAADTTPLGWLLICLWVFSFFIDMFRIPGWVQRYNISLADRV